jgi:PadR family transcriptional regulator PadR
MTRKVLGEFEHQILLAVLRRGSESYSVQIVLELEERTGREVSAAAVLVVLGRLREKGYLQDRMLEPGEGGGHVRRYFSLTDRALEEMRESRKRYLSLWEGMESALEEAPGFLGAGGIV